MAVKRAHFAVDMTPEGVNLWQRGQNDDWLGLGFAGATDRNFSAQIEDMRQRTSQPDTLAEIRVPASDVTVVQIRASDLPPTITNAAIVSLLPDRLPGNPDPDTVCIDICKRGSGRLSVAVVPMTVLNAAAEFSSQQGFSPAYFTSILDPMQFPRSPAFKPSQAPAPVRTKRKPADQTLKMATVAGVVLCVLGALLIRSTIVSAPGAEYLPDPEILVVAADPKPGPKISVPAASTVSVQAPVSGDPGSQTPPPIAPQPRLVAEKIQVPSASTGSLSTLVTPQRISTRVPDTVDIPDLTTSLASPEPVAPALPKAVVQFDLLAGDHIPIQRIAVPTAGESLFRRNAAQNFTQRTNKPGFDNTGLTVSTKKLLNKSVISIEEPTSGTTGRKTIRILPFNTEDGVWNQRFDPQTFIRIAQANIANDAGTETDVSASIIPLGKNATIKETTAAGTHVYVGPPPVAPPERAAQTPETAQVPASSLASNPEPDAQVEQVDTATDALAEPVDISDFTAEIESVLEQTPNGDTLVETAKAAIDAAQDPAPEPTAAPAPIAATKPVAARINTPDANTPRPRPRPAARQPSSDDAHPEGQTPTVEGQSGQAVHRADADTIRPKPRPIGMDRTADARAVENAVTAAIAAGTGTSHAVFISRIPKSRPKNIRQLADRTKASLTLSSRGPNAVVRTAPKGVEKGSNELSNNNTSESVAALATEKARLSKNSMNLIGIYGSASSRRALLRMGSGRYVKVKTGDKVSGWKISAIGESSIRIHKGKRDQVLRMPE